MTKDVYRVDGLRMILSLSVDRKKSKNTHIKEQSSEQHRICCTFRKTRYRGLPKQISKMNIMFALKSLTKIIHCADLHLDSPMETHMTDEQASTRNTEIHPESLRVKVGGTRRYSGAKSPCRWAALSDMSL